MYVFSWKPWVWAGVCVDWDGCRFYRLPALRRVASGVGVRVCASGDLGLWIVAVFPLPVRFQPIFCGIFRRTSGLP